MGEASGVYGIGGRLQMHIRSSRRASSPSLHYMMYEHCLAGIHEDHWFRLSNRNARNLKKADTLLLEAIMMVSYGALVFGVSHNSRRDDKTASSWAVP